MGVEWDKYTIFRFYTAICAVMYHLPLTTKRKSYVSFRLVSISIFDDLQWLWTNISKIYWTISQGRQQRLCVLVGGYLTHLLKWLLFANLLLAVAYYWQWSRPLPRPRLGTEPSRPKPRPMTLKNFKTRPEPKPRLSSRPRSRLSFCSRPSQGQTFWQATVLDGMQSMFILI